jgi:hypothetical protein
VRGPIVVFIAMTAASTSETLGTSGSLCQDAAERGERGQQQAGEDQLGQHRVFAADEEQQARARSAGVEAA